MAQELIYTSARKGLKLGTRGYCTVAHTRGLGASAVRLLESLSAYKNAFPEHAAEAALNPVAISHHRALIHSETVSILSRVGPSGSDHTHRDNKLAHHIVLAAGDRCPAGPAWLAGQGIFRQSWDDEPQLLEPLPPLPTGEAPVERANLWAEVAGDAGWAGVLAHCFEATPNRLVYLVYQPGFEPLPLVAEALALIPVAKRWLVTFSSYFAQLPAGTSCLWRCCLPTLPQLKDPRATANALVIDLTRPLGPPPASHEVAVARGEAEPLPPRRRLRTPAGDEQTDTGFVALRNRHRPTLNLRPEPPNQKSKL